MRRAGSLEIDESERCRRIEGIVERAGWISLAVFLAAGAAGFFGRHPRSLKTAGEGGPLTVEYDRFPHWNTSTDLLVRARPSASDGRVRLSVNDAYADAMLFDRVTPPPIAAASSADRLVFTFAADADRSPLVIRFHLEPQKPGRHTAEFALDDGPPVAFRQFTYP